MSTTGRVFDLLRRLPRITLGNLKDNPGATYKNCKRRRGRHGGKTHGRGTKGAYQHNTFFPIGKPKSKGRPFYLSVRSQTFYTGHHLKLSYVPLTLHKLQLMIDTNRVRCDGPIDVTQLMLTGLFMLEPSAKEGGFILQDEDMEVFSTPINLEVQWATEPTIAAIERVGGCITTAYYDPVSLAAAIRPTQFFTKGVPIPRRMLPPQHLIEYYSNPKNRGYLADPDQVAEERFLLSQKYGYALPDIKCSPFYERLITRKDPRQIFYGLKPGWIVNLPDKVILKPKDPKLLAYYQS